jgi:hypothetical protein
MPARNAASARIAQAIELKMAEAGITRQQLATKVAEQTGRKPGRQWLSRTLSGGSHFTVQVPSEIPNDLLREVANAIDPDRGNELAVELAKLADE